MLAIPHGSLYFVLLARNINGEPAAAPRNVLRGGAVRSEVLGLGPLPRRLDLGLGGGPVGPGGACDRLAGLEVLVDLEEVLDLQLVELGDVVDVAEVLPARVAGRDAEDLVVAALLVAHAEHADGPAADHAAWERRLVQDDQRVQGGA